ncbi:MAG: hypothetical protein HFH82_09070 [Lachnospiraceae bacterium]|nr:hypothetical protein [Lachnospiraceae bacterium]
MKRLCIYLTYDKNKIVDRYIGYMLKELRTCVDKLVVICNEDKVSRGIKILEEYADEIFYRENIGYDAGGFKDALCKFVGWDKITQYDEMILSNDSFFGPFYPMKKIFEQMDAEKLDFWGLTKHGELHSSNRGSFSEHVQSYFIGIRKRMLCCSQFRNYWEEMPYYKLFDDVVKQHEVKFTSYFKKLGYTYDVLAEIDVNNTTKNMVGNYSQYANISYELIRKRNFPFLKKQQLSYDTLYTQTQENLRQAIDYIDKETDYDVELIWENLIRTMNITDLQRSLHLQYVISPDQRCVACGKVALVVFIQYPKSAEYVLEYLAETPSGILVRIYAERYELLEDYQAQGLKCAVASSDRFVEVLSEFSVYDYVCVLHDTDMSSDVAPSCTGKSYFFNVWENLVKDSQHISGILEKFVRESRLGFLAPPQPNFGEYFGEYGRGWNGVFESVLQIVERLQLHCQISRQLPPFRITNNFWIRGCVLHKLKDMLPEEYGYFWYLPMFLAQDSGYYSGIVESTAYASMNEVNMQYYLSQLGALFKQWCGDFHTFYEMKNHLFLCALGGFCRKFEQILIYGAGELAQQYGSLIPEAEAYLVSEGQKKPKELNGKPVKYLSQLPLSEKYGIVLCLNEKNQREVIPLLEKRGIRNYFCI